MKKSLFEKCISFRKKSLKKPTPSEILFAKELDKSKINFTKQKIICPYIVDFFLSKKGIIVEIDGAIHKRADVLANDFKKDEYFSSLNLIVLRYRNDSDFIEEINKILNFKDSPREEHYKYIKRIDKCNGIGSDIYFSRIMKEFNNYDEMIHKWNIYKTKLRSTKYLNSIALI